VVLDRAAIQRWLPVLDEWLLPDSLWRVHHTWPQLYRSDGRGRFFAIRDGERLLSHCATRTVTVHAGPSVFRACLIGSVVTDPALRGTGLASAVLAAALQANATDAPFAILWAERAQLYARAGFRAGRGETLLELARRPRPELAVVRALTVDDHAAVHALHEAKPFRVERSPGAMSALLTTPGMTVLALERGGAVVAYACCGKGADLQGHWHELGGSDEDLARLLPAALHVAGQTRAMLLLPPWRTRLRELLAPWTVDALTVPGPMWWSTGGEPPPFWIDGLDSV
jgi:GNAT superfamily N-acetyltransferase